MHQSLLRHRGCQAVWHGVAIETADIEAEGAGDALTGLLEVGALGDGVLHVRKNFPQLILLIMSRGKGGKGGKGGGGTVRRL